MSLSKIDQSLLLATWFRGNSLEQTYWTSCSDQIVILSLFYTGEITADECCQRFANHSYVGGLYDDNGYLVSIVASRYRQLIDLLRNQPELIEGGGNFEMPADPTYTACRLTEAGILLMPEITERFPVKPDFPNWPDRRSNPDS